MLDTMSCYDKPRVTMTKMLKEIQRVLKTHGKYIAITYGKPEERRFLAQLPFLTFDVE